MEETGPILDVEDGRVQEAIKFLVEIRVFSERGGHRNARVSWPWWRVEGQARDQGSQYLSPLLSFPNDPWASSMGSPVS